MISALKLKMQVNQITLLNQYIYYIFVIIINNMIYAIIIIINITIYAIFNAVIQYRSSQQPPTILYMLSET